MGIDTRFTIVTIHLHTVEVQRIAVARKSPTQKMENQFFLGQMSHKRTSTQWNVRVSPARAQFRRTSELFYERQRMNTISVHSIAKGKNSFADERAKLVRKKWIK